MQMLRTVRRNLNREVYFVHVSGIDTSLMHTVRPYPRYMHLVHRDNTAQSFQSGDNLLRLFLGHTLSHDLWCALDKLFAVHQTQAEQTLDLLDDLGLSSGIERLELQSEQRLLLLYGCSLLFLNWGGWCSWASSKTANGQIGDIQA